MPGMLKTSRRLVLALVLTVFAVGHPLAQQKRPVSYDAYNSWRAIQNTQLSRDGTWLVYALVPEEDDGELVARNLKTGAEYRSPRGRSPIITADGRFVVFAIAPTRAELGKAKKEKKKPEDQPKSGMGVMSLADGQVFTADRVKGFKVADEGSRAVAYLMEPAKAADKKESDSDKPKKKEKKKDPGTDLVIRDLQSGTSATITDVVEYVWSKDGGLLAYGTSTKAGDGDGAFVRTTADGSTKPLVRGLGHYKGFAFDEKGAQLAFATDRDEYKNDTSPYSLYYWKPSDANAAALVGAKTTGMPEGMSVSENGKISFSKDGSNLFLGTAPIPEPEQDDATDPVKVDLWNYKDPLIQPMQKVRADEEKKRSYQALVHLKDRKFFQLASPEMPDLHLTDGSAVAIGESDVPYQQLISWDGDYGDAYVVDLATGAKTRMLRRQHFSPTLSPGGNYVLWYSDDAHAWFAQKVGTTTPVKLTNGKVSFEDETWDTPNQPAPYGVAGWTDGDKSVLLYDRYDIWEVKPDGTGAHMVTQGYGRQQHLAFRYQRLDPEEKTIPANHPLLLGTTDDRTKASGFYRVGLSGSSTPEKIVMLDKQFGRPIKAKNADVLVYSLSRFEEFPDLWVSDGTFANMKKVTNANPQQAQYSWGTAELVDYVNADGKPLRGILFKPDNFDPSKKYPLIVYIYEELTNGLHSYHAPAPGTSINITRYVSNGYVVLEPDIVYDTGYPGESAYKCVIPAVQSVVAKGFVDPKRIGIQGHSWGGYQITYLITRTDMFRAVEAGASVADMVSAYGGIRWGTGMSRAFQYEKTQSRIGGPPWVDPLQYIENSPIFWVEKIHTPYLTIHNDEDDAVPWYQGIEFFSAMRRLGKEAYMFSFNGEKHGLRERANQKYWTVHLDEFFDYYLKDAPKPGWMEKGVPYLERGKRDVTPLYDPTKAKTSPDQKTGGR